MSADTLTTQAKDLAESANIIAQQAADVALQANQVMQETAADSSFFVTGLTVFILACFVGYYVVWRVTPALHSPLMAVTNAISSVIIVGALIAVGPANGDGVSTFLGFLAVILASVNIFGGFIVTRRMLHMFQKRK